MFKIIYEYFYVVGEPNLNKTWNLLKADRETDKMYYGTAFSCGKTHTQGIPFAVNKGNLDEVNAIRDRKWGLIYRVQLNATDEHEARNKARQIIYDYMMRLAERFKNYNEEDE